MDFFPPFLSAIFKPTRRKPDPARQVSDWRTKLAPLLESENRGCVILSVSYRNVSAALSLLNKVYSSFIPGFFFCFCGDHWDTVLSARHSLIVMST